VRVCWVVRTGRRLIADTQSCSCMQQFPQKAYAPSPSPMPNHQPPPTTTRYEGELHVTIIATGFAESYEEQLLSGGAAAAAARRGSGAAPAADRTQAPQAGGAAQAGGPWNKPERASRPYLGRTVF